MAIQHTGKDLATVTERTARALMPYSGKGDKKFADHIAVETMRAALNDLDYRFHVVLGEGAKDDAPMLYTGEMLGARAGDESVPIIDLVVDPLECTTNFARGLPDSMSVLLAVPDGELQLVPGSYMQQLLVPQAVAHLLGKEITLDTPVVDVLSMVADGLGLSIDDLCVVVQDRPRHAGLIAELRAHGAGVSLIESGSISAAYEVISGPSRRLQMLWGIFGAPEALIIAFMANHAGCGFLGRMAPHDVESETETRDLGLEGRVLHGRELVRSGGVLVMSGIHGSSWLPGVECRRQHGRNDYNVHTLFWSDAGLEILEHHNGELVRSHTPAANQD
ncbi:MAG: fructose-bisphosphatase class II [Leptospiraceae bacterium]|nr:fructose-bisphosphatase class II [Leptospiraceae bacterium]MCB1317737.1 fructose-bisphosphatase class II [Leptospiraceae bacterium]